MREVNLCCNMPFLNIKIFIITISEVLSEHI